MNVYLYYGFSKAEKAALNDRHQSYPPEVKPLLIVAASLGEAVSSAQQFLHSKGMTAPVVAKDVIQLDTATPQVTFIMD